MSVDREPKGGIFDQIRIQALKSACEDSRKGERNCPMRLAKLLKLVKQDAKQKYAQVIEKYRREREKEAKRGK